jgi:hypothetical protein
MNTIQTLLYTQAVDRGYNVRPYNQDAIEIGLKWIDPVMDTPRTLWIPIYTVRCMDTLDDKCTKLGATARDFVKRVYRDSTR